MDPFPPATLVIPGMKVGCLPYDALIDSTLECFFSADCLDRTARWISSLPAASWPKPLSSSTMMNFLPNTTVDTILKTAMVDHWKRALNFFGYYHVCSPAQCTYMVVRKNSFIYLITLLIGLCGGLSIAFRIVVPSLVRYRRFFFAVFRGVLCQTYKITKLPQEKTILFLF